MAEHEIPPPFRSLFGGPALDEPKPPDVEDEGDDDDDGHHFHVHVQMAVPKLMVLSDGSVRSDGWTGSLLVGWCWLASAATVASALWAAWTWLESVKVMVAMASLVLASTALAVLSLAVLVKSAAAVVSWWRARKASVQP